MWVGVVFVLLGGIPAHVGFSGHKYDDEDNLGSLNTDFYDSYEQDIATFSTDTTDMEALNRIRRYEGIGDRVRANDIRSGSLDGGIYSSTENSGEIPDFKTSNPVEVHDHRTKPDEIHDVKVEMGAPDVNKTEKALHDIKEALKHILYRDRPTSNPGAAVDSYTDIYDYVEKSKLRSEEQRLVPAVPARSSLKTVTHTSRQVTKESNTLVSEADTSTNEARQQDFILRDDLYPKNVIPKEVIPKSHTYPNEDGVRKEVYTITKKGATKLDESDDWLNNDEIVANTRYDVTNYSPFDEKKIQIKNWSPITRLSVVHRWRPKDTMTSLQTMCTTEMEVSGKEDNYNYVVTNTLIPSSWGTQTEASASLIDAEQDKETLSTDTLSQSLDTHPIADNYDGLRQRKPTTKCPTTRCGDKVYPTTPTPPTPTPTRMPICNDSGLIDPNKVPFDIDAIVNIIANLTYDYEWDLAEKFNKTLIEHGVPSCPTETTATTTTTAPPAYNFANTSVVSKCFVCGLKDEEIPRDAFCADAFAGDFLPLMPIDPRARGQIATYRKYCRHLDVHNYVENPSEPRSIYGRFTGGCGVRWTDLTGVYTQRTCRARFRPLMGKHFASKRMAKLELALINVENGCIISPMASLLPLSRGISLYARFHACVCTGSWCNTAVALRHMLHYTLHSTIALCYTLVLFFCNI